MQAIQTKFLGPTNSRGSRIKATCAAGSRTVEYDHAMNVEENHCYAAQMLQEKLGWLSHGELAFGTLSDGSFVHVLKA